MSFLLTEVINVKVVSTCAGIGEATFELVKPKLAVLIFSQVALPQELVYLASDEQNPSQLQCH